MTLTRDDISGLYTFEQNGTKIAYPSVSNIVRPIVDTHAAEYHLNKGRLVHRACEIADMDQDGGLHWPSLDPILVPYVEAWLDFKGMVGLKAFSLIEHPMVCHKLRFAGRPDRTLDNIAILEIKCGAVRPWYGIQLAGYARLLTARFSYLKPNILRQSVHLFDTGKWRLETWKDQGDDRVFMACLELTNWHLRNKA